mmetsp:Transcript_7498/g.12796  ORF Transcript_7498/g.12796 Transcript_7498/m.12796 type:complete len:580 (+) Transcript_7498:1764-3503(+)
MRPIYLFLRHFLDHFLQRNGRVRIAANGAQRVPHIGAHKVRGRHAAPDLIIPADTALRARVPLHRRAQIPLKRALIIALNPKAKRIHDADQFFGVRIAGSGRRPQRLIGRLIGTRLHQITGFFDLCKGRKPNKNKGYRQFLPKVLHVLLLSAAPAFADDLPRALTADDFIAVDPAQAKLGQLLFYDRILSGNQNIACSTCHHPDLGTGDGLSLGIGEGGVGLGPERTAGTGDDRIRKRIPRNAPGLWNLGAKDLNVMFHDGRLSVADTYENGFNSPAEEWLPDGLDNLLAAQAIFPLVAQFEMAGNPKENEVAGAVHRRIDYAWPILTHRVRHVPAYAEMFVDIFPHITTGEDITIADIANALSAFMIAEWTSFDSPFDAYLAGDETALTKVEKRGMDVFYGTGGCATCHAGALMSDQGFHAIGLPPFGPGRTRRFDPMVRDVGHMGESDDLADAYAFRTPMLRNVELTAPYGHNGAYPTLEDIVKHHLNPIRALDNWTPATAALPEVPWLAAIDFMVWQDPREIARQRAAVTIKPRAMSNSDQAAIVAFLKALTGTESVKGQLGIPTEVPSGLPVDLE